MSLVILYFRWILGCLLLVVREGERNGGKRKADIETIPRLLPLLFSLQHTFSDSWCLWTWADLRCQETRASSFKGHWAAGGGWVTRLWAETNTRRTIDGDFHRLSLLEWVLCEKITYSKLEKKVGVKRRMAVVQETQERGYFQGWRLQSRLLTKWMDDSVHSRL